MGNSGAISLRDCTSAYNQLHNQSEIIFCNNKCSNTSINNTTVRRQYVGRFVNRMWGARRSYNMQRMYSHTVWFRDGTTCNGIIADCNTEILSNNLLQWGISEQYRSNLDCMQWFRTRIDWVQGVLSWSCYVDVTFMASPFCSSSS
jgi:hypothetical protein